MAKGGGRVGHGRGTPGVRSAQVRASLNNHANQGNSNNSAYHSSRGGAAPASGTGNQGAGK
jgi:hypothetical protein